MIVHIQGTLTYKTEEFAVIEAGGVGHQIFIPQSVLEKLPEKNQACKLFTYHYIREDQLALFGFLTLEDRDFFVQLITVSGIGPKLGIKIMSHALPSQLIQAITKQDAPFLTTIPGIGKKMAERMILELKEKLPKLYTMELTSIQKSGKSSPLNPDLESDLLLAMKTLGYQQDEIKRALQKTAFKLDGETTLEESLKLVLKHL